MTDQEQQFAEEFLRNGFNTTAAARTAGYADPNAHGHRVRYNAEVKVYIDERLAERRMSADEVLSRIQAIAEADMTDFLEVDGSLATLDIGKARRSGATHLIKKFKYSRKTGLEIELHDKQTALNTLAKANGLLKDRIEHDFTKLSDADLIARAKELFGGTDPSRPPGGDAPAP